ncbi:MAG: hypothetical protein EDS66_11725 [Planctomycetota bacterium]|nr:MAG: hypothetical protein EDS66_11725 [Planctomycetota bacterium]MCQ3922279.1 hypothetical protein [Planctomycetota bacterium]
MGGDRGDRRRERGDGGFPRDRTGADADDDRGDVDDADVEDDGGRADGDGDARAVHVDGKRVERLEQRRQLVRGGRGLSGR